MDAVRLEACANKKKVKKEKHIQIGYQDRNRGFRVAISVDVVVRPHRMSAGAPLSGAQDGIAMASRKYEPV